jgi:hypothetical protein
VKYNIVLEFFENGGQAVSTLIMELSRSRITNYSTITVVSLVQAAAQYIKCGYTLGQRQRAIRSNSKCGTAATCTQIKANGKCNATGAVIDVSTVSTFNTLVTGYSNFRC